MRKNTVKKKKKRGWLKKLLLFLLVLALLVVGGGAFLLTQMRQNAVTYVSYSAATGTISNALSFSGSLKLIDNETFTATGKSTVRELYVAEGQDVKAGEKLLRMSNGQTVEASFDGRVNQLYVTVGDEVKAGESLVQVADFVHMQVAVNVDEYDIGDVQVGTQCTITTTATEKTYQSSIASINYISSSGGSVAYYTATAYVDVGEGVYPGMQVTLTIPQEEARNVVVLNMDALSFDVTNQAYVLMEAEDGTMQQVNVTTGVSNGKYVEIKDGLKSGDRVYVATEVTAAAGMGFNLFSLFGGTGFGNMSFGTTQGVDMTEMMQRRQQMTEGGGTFTYPGGGSGGGFGGGGR